MNTTKTLGKGLSEKFGVTKQLGTEIVEHTFSQIKEIVQTDRVKIDNFGMFKLVETKPRKGRVVKRGIEVIIPARRVIKFKQTKT